MRGPVPGRGGDPAGSGVQLSDPDVGMHFIEADAAAVRTGSRISATETIHMRLCGAEKTDNCSVN